MNDAGPIAIAHVAHPDDSTIHGHIELPHDQRVTPPCVGEGASLWAGMTRPLIGTTERIAA
jgi:hypothetical protein